MNLSGPRAKRALSALVGIVVVLIGAFIGIDKVNGSAAPSNVPVANGSTSDGSTYRWIDASALPAEARTVLEEIDHGGPYEYPGKDGSVFGNYEGILPHESSGYYHEYTVDTPGASTRGTRRIITGSGGELYWTADHYASFQRIRR